MSNSHAKQEHTGIDELSVRTTAFASLGRELSVVARALLEGHPPRSDLQAARALYDIALDSPNQNPWFTISQVSRALAALGHMLREDKIKQWLDPYSLPTPNKSKAHGILVIMAGNIPLVGFHDFVTVLISGHRFVGKLSSQDKQLPLAVGQLLSEIEPGFASMMSFHESQVASFDAVIATGSDNSSRYFLHYFSQYPHIIRKNRTSIAVLDGNESAEDLHALGQDVFSYYGRGCRNVSQLWLPAGYNPDTLGPAWATYALDTSHHKFMNNYIYHKAMYQAGNMPHTDTGFCLLREQAQPVSPLSVIHLQYYNHLSQAEAFVRANEEVIQTVIAAERVFRGSLNTISPGKGQWPELYDYADGTDTLAFLLSL
jgi:hypothetical protein